MFTRFRPFIPIIGTAMNFNVRCHANTKNEKPRPINFSEKTHQYSSYQLLSLNSKISSFNGSRKEAEDYVRSRFKTVESSHVHDKFRLLDEYLTFIESNNYYSYEPRWVQSQFSLHSDKHVNLDGTNGCCIAAAYHLVKIMNGYGHIFAQRKVYDRFDDGPFCYDHVGVFMKYDSGVIILDEYDNDILSLENGEIRSMLSNKMKFSLDNHGNKVLREIYDNSGTLISATEILLNGVSNPDDAVGRYYFFGDPSKKQSHQFFMRRKNKAFAKLNFDKRELTLRLGTNSSSQQIKIPFDQIMFTELSLESSLKSTGNAQFFEHQFYEDLGITHNKFWSLVRRFIKNESIIKRFFCFPDN